MRYDPCECMPKRSAAIIGANGEMGRYLLRPLLEQNVDILHCIDLDSSEDEREAAFGADIIVLAVPQAAVADIVRHRRLHPSQALIDICSIKRDVIDVMTATGCGVLSTHPMNGPHTPWTQQKWIVVGEMHPGHEGAAWFLSLLREKGALIEHVEDAATHDRLMGLVLGLPEFLTLVVSRYLALPGAVPLASLRDAAAMGSPAFASLLQTHLHTIHSTPAWLREELLLRTSPDSLALYAALARDLSSPDFLARAPAMLIEQGTLATALALPDDFFVTIRENVTRAFEQHNDVFHGRTSGSRRDLYVQKACSGEDICAHRTSTRVGIHGIRGSFTDEAWHRFAGEVTAIPDDAVEIVELVHSSNVLRAVDEGEVDIGIFAFANSGSGGYLASVEAMGRHRYELLALFTMPINMCMLTHPSVSTVQSLRRFFGHPVALSQCRHTLAQRWPDIPVEPADDAMDTALSARELAAGHIDRQTAVFASKRAAELYNLRVLVEGVHHDPNNATAFAVVRRRAS